jgi:hypothetical protein
MNFFETDEPKESPMDNSDKPGILELRFNGHPAYRSQRIMELNSSYNKGYRLFSTAVWRDQIIDTLQLKE